MDIIDSFINSAQRLMPSWFLRHFKGDWGREGFKKYLANTGWLFGARIVSFLTSFLTVAFVARYLGPANLGKLEYAQSMVAIISVFASLGLDQILYRDLVSEHEKENDLLGTAIIAKTFFGILAFLSSIGLSIYFGNDIILTSLIAICAATFVINPIGTVSLLFHARIRSKYSSQINIFLAFFLPALKIILIFLNKGILYFASILIVEALISAGWALFVYVRYFHKDPLAWRFRFETFKRLMADSWPLLFAGFSGYIYAKMDQIMILHLLDDATVGVYSAAVKITQIWAFLPSLIITSLFPAIINARKTDLVSYAKRLRSLFSIAILSTVAIALPLFIFAPIVVSIIFGPAFAGSSSILRIYLWVSVAITLVVLVQHYLIAENFGKILLYSNLIGAGANIILNLILIPRFGSHGSAWGTMFSYTLVALCPLFFRESRKSITLTLTS